MVGNAAVVNFAYESFLRGDVQGVTDLLDPTIHWSVPESVPHGGEFHGLDEVGTFFEGLGAAWRPLALEIEAVDEVGADLVVGIVQVSGTLGGSGVSYGSVHVFTVRDGKITRFREFVDLNACLAG